MRSPNSLMRFSRSSMPCVRCGPVTVSYKSTHTCEYALQMFHTSQHVCIKTFSTTCHLTSSLPGHSNDLDSLLASQVGRDVVSYSHVALLWHSALFACSTTFIIRYTQINTELTNLHHHGAVLPCIHGPCHSWARASWGQLDQGLQAE